MTARPVDPRIAEAAQKVADSMPAMSDELRNRLGLLLRPATPPAEPVRKTRRRAAA